MMGLLISIAMMGISIGAQHKRSNSLLDFLCALLDRDRDASRLKFPAFLEKSALPVEHLATSSCCRLTAASSCQTA